jgi:hypothetical protein
MTLQRDDNARPVVDFRNLDVSELIWGVSDCCLTVNEHLFLVCHDDNKVPFDEIMMMIALY